MIAHLHVDIETYSPADLQSAGLYNYVAHPDFEVILLAYAIDEGPVKVTDLLGGEPLPDEFLRAYCDDSVSVVAHNATFERLCLGKLINPIPVHRWVCTMAMCAYAGIELSLARSAWMLGLDHQKMAIGKPCISYFCSPCKPTKSNEGRTRNYPRHNPELWRVFKDYCAQDVRTEIAVFNRLIELPEREKKIYELDQEINDRGVLVDLNFVRRAAELNGENAQSLADGVTALGVGNPNSVQQMREFCAQHGVALPNMQAATVASLLQDPALPEVVRTALSARQGLRKASVKKYTAILEQACEDSRIRGLFQYYGATRTGRWAGRYVQVHNLPRNYLPGIKLARAMVTDASNPKAAADVVQLCYGDVADTLSQLIRTAFVASKDATLVVVDFSAIEARVLAWLADETWRLEVFAGHGKIYEASASRMFNIPVEEVTKGSQWRQLGKVAELALGYQGSVGALKAMGADKLGLDEATMRDTVTKWRSANKNIAQFWYACEEAARDAIRSPREVFLVANKNVELRFFTQRGWLCIGLPSGRSLYYYRPLLITRSGDIPDVQELYNKLKSDGLASLPAIEAVLAVPPASAPAWLKRASTNNYNYRSLLKLFLQMERIKKDFGEYRPTIAYHENGGGTVTPQQLLTSTYSGKLVENITQAVARDCLAEAIITVHEREGILPVMHVHDEVVYDLAGEVTKKTLERFEGIIAEPILWAPNLPLKSDGFLTKFYKKEG